MGCHGWGQKLGVEVKVGGAGWVGLLWVWSGRGVARPHGPLCPLSCAFVTYEKMESADQAIAEVGILGGDFGGNLGVFGVILGFPGVSPPP